MTDAPPYPLVVRGPITALGKGVAVVRNDEDLVTAIRAVLDLYPDVPVTVERLQEKRDE